MTTHSLSTRGDPHLGEDALFGVKPELVGDFKRTAGKGARAGRSISVSSWSWRAKGAGRHDQSVHLFAAARRISSSANGASTAVGAWIEKLGCRRRAGPVDAASGGRWRGAGQAAGLARCRRLCRRGHAHAGRCHRSGDGRRCRASRPTASLRSAAARPPGSARRSPIAPTCRRSSSRRPMPDRK